MRAEDKELLTRDLCARLPYGVNVGADGRYEGTLEGVENMNTIPVVRLKGVGIKFSISFVKPYLRPMSSLTDKEWADCVRSSNISYDGNEQHRIVTALMADARARWYDKHMFDHRGLLPKGLAIEMPKEMYKS